jgi:iron complex transport system substrate-binding protein
MIKKLKAVFVCAITIFIASEVMASSANNDYAGYPMIIEHKFGTTVIQKKPERVASLDYAGADDLLALDVQPVVIRYWYGNFLRAVWPWAEPLLKGTPSILRGSFNYEQIAAAKPDVIIALYSGIDKQDYEKLSLIAPVVAVPKGVGDYAMQWDDRALLAGKVIGKEAEAKEKIDAIHQKLAEVASHHPRWQGKTAAIAHASRGDGSSLAYTSKDIRMQVLEEIGFVTPKSVNALIGNLPQDYIVHLSAEDLSPIDADLLIWLSFDGNWDNVKKLAARPFLAVTQEGRDVYAGGEVSGAFSHTSLLSLPYAIERLVPMIEAALDGNPETHNDDRDRGLE